MVDDVECPHCKSYVCIEHSNHDYADEFAHECSKCNRSLTVFAEQIVEFRGECRYGEHCLRLNRYSLDVDNPLLMCIKCDYSGTAYVNRKAV